MGGPSRTGSNQPKAALNRKRDSLHTVSVGALIASKWFK